VKSYSGEEQTGIAVMDIASRQEDL